MPQYKIALKKSYLAMIKNAVGTNMFRNFYLIKNGRVNDDTKDGQLSCALFVTAILYHFGLIKKPHLTVKSTQADLKTSGWRKIKGPKPGAVLFWEEKYNNGSANRHVGFYLGQQMAISNMASKRKPGRHHWTYNNARQVEAIYWHSELNNKQFNGAGKKLDKDEKIIDS
ncbi:MAG: hypothetical protein COU85_00860 [Candidatus Portnoybacteria bacterium CG10_big_fil_rev_8_21_14_0_10_44_7]|uniref:Uncharacterized protein n=1 Tax=Candidatus Portnoybacteria bacterium CG10_big_fil_rev_8_21_14_0_10_44_7 TaxID=1974816 RepID=A0A2M8KJ79_9BACT|nr:MAG: hypothetical protein COU85_00860 [Candidatus Portnoybacteria bacterium CG10_big_fil_rev_8_21_14_0_10_44_7]